MLFRHSLCHHFRTTPLTSLWESQGMWNWWVLFKFVIDSPSITFHTTFQLSLCYIFQSQCRTTSFCQLILSQYEIKKLLPFSSHKSNYEGNNGEFLSHLIRFSMFNFLLSFTHGLDCCPQVQENWSWLFFNLTPEQYRL